jgi:Transposase zinc-binding domain
VPREGLEVADVFRHFGPAFRDRHGASLSTAQRHAMIAIESCRTAALRGHVERCDDCGHQRISYNSCLMGKFSNGESRVAPFRSPPFSSAMTLILSP